MRKILIGSGLICVIGALICVICGYLWAGSGAYTQTTFTAGSFSDTIGANGNNDVTLLPSPDAGNGADGAGTVTANTNLNTGSICGRTSPNWDAVNFSCIDNTAAGQNQIILNSATTNGLSTSGGGDEVMIINLAGNAGQTANTWAARTAAPNTVAGGGALALPVVILFTASREIVLPPSGVIPSQRILGRQ